VRIAYDAAVGTPESGDALVRVSPGDSLEVNVSTSVEAQYGDAVREVVARTLAESGLETGIVTVVDKGALDCTLQARVRAAVARGTGQPINWAELAASLP
jgi:citrate lyase subunit gamma (acyl carrier protein)